MRYEKTDKGYMVRLFKGEKVHESLVHFAEKLSISTASYYGIGGIAQVELGYFRSEKKQYQKKIFEGDYELVSFIGNLCELDGKPFCHSHVTMGDENYQSIPGHLFEATIFATMEIHLIPFSNKWTRILDPEMGFYGLNLNGKI